MANPEHVQVVKQGAEAIEKWEEEHPEERLRLQGTDLRGAVLSGANLSGTHINSRTKFDNVVVTGETKGLGPWIFNPEKFILREIEFPPEYRQAGLGIMGSVLKVEIVPVQGMRRSCFKRGKMYRMNSISTIRTLPFFYVEAMSASGNNTPL